MPWGHSAVSKIGWQRQCPASSASTRRACATDWTLSHRAACWRRKLQSPWSSCALVSGQATASQSIISPSFAARCSHRRAPSACISLAGTAAPRKCLSPLTVPQLETVITVPLAASLPPSLPFSSCRARALSLSVCLTPPLSCPAPSRSLQMEHTGSGDHLSPHAQRAANRHIAHTCATSRRRTAAPGVRHMTPSFPRPPPRTHAPPHARTHARFSRRDGSCVDMWTHVRMCVMHVRMCGFTCTPIHPHPWDAYIEPGAGPLA